MCLDQNSSPNHSHSLKIDLPIRRIVVSLLCRIEKTKAFSNILLQQEKTLSSPLLLNQDPAQRSSQRALITELFYGVLRYQLLLDKIIELAQDKPKRLSRLFINILRVAIYQIYFLDYIPKYAAINEAVSQVKTLGGAPLASLANAILRNLPEQLEEIWSELASDSNSDQEKFTAYLSLKTSHPLWLIKSWLPRWGASETESLCQANNERPSISLRILTKKLSPAKYIELLNNQGWGCRAGSLLNQAIIVSPKGRLITDLPGYQAGWIQVQDEAAQLVSLILAPKPEERILDCCAAPGSKTLLISNLMEDRGCIIASDISFRGIRRIKSNLTRLGYNSIHLLQADAAKASNVFKMSFNKILVDVPCSGTGTLRRHPEIKWFKSPENVTQLNALQNQILNGVAPLVAANGNIIYSTCSLQYQENEAIIKKFLDYNKNFRIDEIELPAEVKRKDLFTEDGFLQTLPHKHRTDGIFIASLKKKG